MDSCGLCAACECAAGLQGGLAFQRDKSGQRSVSGTGNSGPKLSGSLGHHGVYVLLCWGHHCVEIYAGTRGLGRHSLTAMPSGDREAKDGF